MPNTLYMELSETARQNPNQTAWEYFGNKSTYQELLSDIDVAAAAFVAQGITQGHRVAICLPNCPQLIISLYALNKIGAVAVLQNPKTSASELACQLDMTGCCAVIYASIASTRMLQAICSLGQKAEKLLFLIRVKTLQQMSMKYAVGGFIKTFPQKTAVQVKKVLPPCCKHFDFHRFMHLSPQKQAPLWQDGDGDAVILFSGGTSGQLRGIIHSSHAINQSALQCIATQRDRLRGVPTMLAVLPAFHMFGLTVVVHIILILGGICLLVPVFDPYYITSLFIKKRPTYMAGVPTIFQRMLDTGLLQKALNKGRLDTTRFLHGFCGGDFLPHPVRDAFNQLMAAGGGEGFISEGYGLTECCPVTLNFEPDYSYPSIGLPFGGIQVGIFVPDSDQSVGPGEQGEICIDSVSIMKRSITGEGVETTDMLQRHSDGKTWLHTGDIGYVDRTGRVYFCHRLRRLIKVSGNTVLAPEVERVIEQLPFVKKAYVVGQKSQHRGSEVVAYVTLHEFPEETAEQERLIRKLSSHCSISLTPWARPVAFKLVREKDIPRTALDKIAWGKLERDGIRQ